MTWVLVLTLQQVYVVVGCRLASCRGGLKITVTTYIDILDDRQLRVAVCVLQGPCFLLQGTCDARVAGQ